MKRREHPYDQSYLPRQKFCVEFSLHRMAFLTERLWPQVLILYFMPRTMQVTSRLENTNTNKRVFKTDSDICQISRFWVYYWLVFVLCSLRFCVKRTIFWFYEGKLLFSQFYRWWSWGLENIKGLLYIGS